MTPATAQRLIMFTSRHYWRYRVRSREKNEKERTFELNALKSSKTEDLQVEEKSTVVSSAVIQRWLASQMAASDKTTAGSAITGLVFVPAGSNLLDYKQIRLARS